MNNNSKVSTNSKLKNVVLYSALALGAIGLGGITNNQQAHADTVQASSEQTVQAPEAAQASQNDTTYEINYGDTLNKISAAKGISVEELKEINNIADINKIYAGETLSLVQDNTPAPQAQAATPAPAAQPAAAGAQAPVQAATPAPAAQPAAPVAQAPAQDTSATQAQTGTSTDQAAKDWIASRESGGNYNATNGKYIGKYQLDSSYLNGDYSPANQEAVANNYATSRYGSWSNAQAFWQSHGWY